MDLGAVLLAILHDLTDLPDLHGANQIWPYPAGFTGTARICPNLLPSFLGCTVVVPSLMHEVTVRFYEPVFLYDVIKRN